LLEMFLGRRCNCLIKKVTEIVNFLNLCIVCVMTIRWSVLLLLAIYAEPICVIKQCIMYALCRFGTIRSTLFGHQSGIHSANKHIKTAKQRTIIQQDCYI